MYRNIECSSGLRQLASTRSPAHCVCAVDDYFFGVLHSRAHELWARRLGTQFREAESGSRYTPTTCFETFPFPWPPGQEPADNPTVAAIAQATRELVQFRDAWLNPPDASDAELKKRTLTNLYNARPTWLDNAHRKLDAAVCRRLRLASELSDEEILARLLALNLAARRRPESPKQLTARMWYNSQHSFIQLEDWQTGGQKCHKKRN